MFFSFQLMINALYLDVLFHCLALFACDYKTHRQGKGFFQRLLASPHPRLGDRSKARLGP